MTPGGLIHAEVVNVKGLYRRHAAFRRKLLVNAEGVSLDLSVQLGDEDRRVRVGKDLFQLLAGVFFGSRLKKVGTGVAVDLVNLIEKPVQIREIFCFSRADAEFVHEKESFQEMASAPTE